MRPYEKGTALIAILLLFTAIVLLAVPALLTVWEGKLQAKRADAEHQARDLAEVTLESLRQRFDSLSSQYPGADPTELLQRAAADVRMTETDRSGAEVSSWDDEQTKPGRLSMAGEMGDRQYVIEARYTFQPTGDSPVSAPSELLTVAKKGTEGGGTTGRDHFQTARGEPVEPDFGFSKFNAFWRQSVSAILDKPANEWPPDSKMIEGKVTLNRQEDVEKWAQTDGESKREYIYARDIEAACRDCRELPALFAEQDLSWESSADIVVNGPLRTGGNIAFHRTGDMKIHGDIIAGKKMNAVINSGHFVVTGSIVAVDSTVTFSGYAPQSEYEIEGDIIAGESVTFEWISNRFEVQGFTVAKKDIRFLHFFDRKHRHGPLLAGESVQADPTPWPNSGEFKIILDQAEASGMKEQTKRPTHLKIEKWEVETKTTGST